MTKVLHTLLIPILLLASCASGPSERELERLAMLNTPEGAGIVVRVQALNCSFETASFKDLKTGESIWQRPFSPIGSIFSGYGVLHVEPGQYTLHSARGNCRDAGSSQTFWVSFDNADGWFEPLVVGLGEIVYPGTIVLEQRVQSPVNTVKTSALDRIRSIQNTTERFGLFSIDNESPKVERHIKGKFPDAAHKFVFRPLQSKYSVEEGRQLIKEWNEVRKPYLRMKAKIELAEERGETNTAEFDSLKSEFDGVEILYNDAKSKMDVYFGDAAVTS